MPGEDQKPVLHMGIGKGRCKACAAPIVFAYTAGGKLAPFQLDNEGEWSLENGNAKHVGKRSPQLQLGAPPEPQRYTSHFATCPDAAKFRGTGRDAS